MRNTFNIQFQSRLSGTLPVANCAMQSPDMWSLIISSSPGYEVLESFLYCTLEEANNATAHRLLETLQEKTSDLQFVREFLTSMMDYMESDFDGTSNHCYLNLKLEHHNDIQVIKHAYSQMTGQTLDFTITKTEPSLLNE
jgi:uncharacterized protein YlbG (UPF0298 family)